MIFVQWWDQHKYQNLEGKRGARHMFFVCLYFGGGRGRGKIFYRFHLVDANWGKDKFGGKSPIEYKQCILV